MLRCGLDQLTGPNVITPVIEFDGHSASSVLFVRYDGDDDDDYSDDLPASAMSTKTNFERAVLESIAAHFTTHNLKARDLTVASASSFIIVVSVGFLILIMTCIGSSAYYRRRFRRGHWPEGWDAPTEVPVPELRSRPEIWDVSVLEGKKPAAGKVSCEDWTDILVSFCTLCIASSGIPVVIRSICLARTAPGCESGSA